MDLITVDMAGSDQMGTIMFVVRVFRMCTLSSDPILFGLLQTYGEIVNRRNRNYGRSYVIQ